MPSLFHSPLVVQILFLIAVCSASIGYLLFFFWKRKLVNSTNFQWQEMILRTAHGGYYVWDAGREREFFSLNLVNIFRMRDEQQNFSEFTKFFEYEKDIFEHTFNELLEGKKQRFVFNLRANIFGRTHYLLCSGYRVEKADYSFEGVILWFFDVTDYMVRMQEITDEMQHFRKGKRDLAALLNHLPFPVWQRDSSGAVSYCNQTYSRCSEAGVPEHKSAVPDLYPGMSKEIKNALDNDGVFSEQKHLIIDNKRILVHVHELALDRAGGGVGFALDIHQEQELRKELKGYGAAYGDLLESSSSAMTVFDKDTRLSHYNGAFVRQFNLERDYLDESPTFQDILERLRASRQLPEQKNFSAFRVELLDLFRRELSEPYNDFFHLPDGRYLRMIAISHITGGLLIIFEDHTDNLKIRSSYNRLVAVQKATLDNLKEGILLVGSDGKISLFNPRLCDIFPEHEHMLANEPHIKDALDAFRSDFDMQDNWEQFREEFTGRTVSRKHMVITQGIGGKIYTISFIPLPDGRTLISFLEVTSSVMLERTLSERNEALEQADKLKNDFLAGISYDLRTPLTSIIGFSEALREEFFGNLNTTQREYVVDIYSAANQLLAMINNIIDVARIRAGKLELNIQEADPCKLIDAAIRLVEGAAAEKGMSVSAAYKKTRGILLECDRERVTQMLFYALYKATLAPNNAGNHAILSTLPYTDEQTGLKGILFYVTLRTPGHTTPGKLCFANAEAGLRDSVEDLNILFVQDVIERHAGMMPDDASLPAEASGAYFACILPLTHSHDRGSEAEDAVQQTHTEYEVKKTDKRTPLR